MHHILVILCIFTLCSFKKVPYNISDNGVYPKLCAEAAKQDEAFNHFKQDPYYNVVVEYHTFEEGLEDLAYIREHYPRLFLHLEKFRKNDEFGNPRRYEYEGIGRFSPSTLHMIKLAGDIKEALGSLDGMKVIEIGAGYGGLCKILSDLHQFESYTLVDLPGPLALARKFLELQGVTRVKFLTPEMLSQEEFDVVISNYGFSECDRKAQMRLMQQVFEHAKKGYLACNFFPKYFKVRPFGREELMKKLKKSGLDFAVRSEEPLMGKDNIIITWR